MLVVIRATKADAESAIPAPSAQAADIFISGRTLKPLHVNVKDIGQALPQTLAGVPLTNSRGFGWYVSRHFALKTDVGNQKAAAFLQLLECAYPYYVYIFGGEPAGIETKRLPVVYAKDRKGLEHALQSDDIKWDFTGGGITFERIHIAYAYPSGSLDYHQRYILLHECTHLFQMCLTGHCDNTPLWYCEGIADAISSHVYDENTRQITLDVLDKATVPNYLDSGLASLQSKPQTIRKIDVDEKVSRGVGFLLVQFLRSTPAREKAFRIWSRVMMSGPYRPKTDASARAERATAMEKYFGPLDTLDAEFSAWRKARQNTFHYVEWGWEQDGDALVAYGFAPGGKLSQTDLLLPPGEAPREDRWRLDYPHAPMPHTVGPVARGVTEPAIGALLDFRDDPHRGLAGIGLGVMGAADKSGDGLHADHGTMLKVLIREGKTLEIDASELAGKVISLPLSDDVRMAMDASGNQVGLTVQIRNTALHATVRAQKTDENHLVTFNGSMDIDDAMRRRLLERPLCVLARDGWQRVTPFFDPGPGAPADPQTPSPIGRWGTPFTKD